MRILIAEDNEDAANAIGQSVQIEITAASASSALTAVVYITGFYYY